MEKLLFSLWITYFIQLNSLSLLAFPSMPFSNVLCIISNYDNVFKLERRKFGHSFAVAGEQILCFSNRASETETAASLRVCSKSVLLFC